MGAGDAGLPPLFSQVEPLFGVGAFARGGTRFQHFVQGGSPTALAFESAWNELARGAAAGAAFLASGPDDSLIFDRFA